MLLGLGTRCLGGKMWSLKSLQELDVQAEINGKWVPARPLGFYSLRVRLRDAWEVFMGRADAFKWPEGDDD